MTNGNNINSANGRGPWKTSFKGIRNLGAGEILSTGVSLGVVAVADDFAPKLLKNASKSLAASFVEPHLETIERILGKVCRLKECQPDPNKPREERAESLAHTLIVFSAAWVTSMLAKIALRKVLNSNSGISSHKEPLTNNWFLDKVLFRWQNKHDWAITCFDEGVHLGSLVLVNTAFAKQADTAIDMTSKVLQKTMGWSERKAKDVASMGIIWEVPNALGYVAGAGVIARKAFKDHAQALAASTHLSSSGPTK